MWYFRFRNWVMVPTVEVLLIKLAAKVLGVPTSWQFWVLVVWVSIIIDLADAYVEGRPVMGPYRWKQRPNKK